ncbi:MAG TPA: PfkB family carbohydrate kinase [Gaiellaceae bacterium]|jgi:ribokinase|nr:PfkB family carbohydrate kinase [Gaiellaceae bacterium]
MTYDLVAVGDVMLDVHVVTPPGNGVVHEGIRVCAGGSAVNAARAARRLGARVAVVGRVGDDAAGAAIDADLRRSGIAPLLEIEADAVTGTVAYVGAGVVADRGANAGFTPAGLPAARVTLVSGYLDTDAVGAALAHAQGVRAVDLQRAGQRAFDADVVLGPNIPVEDFAAHHRVVCATLAERGALAVSGGERLRVVPERVLAASPRGGGDAFAAAFLLALADDHPLRTCLERGCAAVLEL